MALAQVHGVVLSGVLGAMVRVEVEVAKGLPSVGVVGLPDAAVSEARWRARSAVTSIGAKWPDQRVTVNLSPAEVRKNGAGLDLPIAVGVLLASEQLPGVDVSRTTFIGELGLDGRVRPTVGAMAGALAARTAGLDRVIVPPECMGELARIAGLTVIGVRSLGQVVSVLRGTDPGELDQASDRPEAPAVQPDLADVRGHEHARFALEVVAAGGHHLAMVGPPGVGKTLLAERLPALLPDLADDEAVEVAAIHSLTGESRLGAFARPPYQAPHHSASAAALLGSVHGSRVTPGAVTLAHRGVLFLDEAPEFARPALEALRQPLESGTLRLGRSGWAGMLPARIQLVLAANPCPCGRRVGTGSQCSCPPAAVRRYGARLSGPLLDRLDVRLLVLRPRPAELRRTEPAESSVAVRDRVRSARERASHRLRDLPWVLNAQVPTGVLRRWSLPAAAADLLSDLERTCGNLRSADRVLRLAWTLADLAGRDAPSTDDVARGLSLRGASLPWAA